MRSPARLKERSRPDKDRAKRSTGTKRLTPSARRRGPASPRPVFVRPRLRHPAMLLCQHGLRRHRRHGGLEPVAQSRDHVAGAALQGFIALERHFGWIHLVRVLTDLSVYHARPPEEVRIRRAGHEDGDRDVAVLELVAQGEGEAVYEGLAPVIDRLEAARHEAGDGAGEKDSAFAPLPHSAPGQIGEPERPRNIGVHHMKDVGQVLIKEGAAQAMTRIGRQDVDGTLADQGPQGRYPSFRRQVDLHGFHVRAHGFKTLPSI
uniref:Transposase n=1 Tax=Parastrongyloides trichosuri TaxID=131310 RepID=A0A0N4ZXW1_PARTI